jgi:glycosyltransferase involved in cell wall biosynthesis
MSMMCKETKVAVMIPCYNEEMTIAKVIRDFRNHLPDAEIFVFDNNSTDSSSAKALDAGATIIKEKRQGKGFVVTSMLKKIEADIYVMVDGDDTYPADAVIDLLQPILDDEADMVVGQRLSQYSDGAFRPFHVFGNHFVCNLINLIFTAKLQDPMSGYRVFTSTVALELPVVAYGFDVETEMTIQLLYRKFVIKELPVQYRERQKGSVSKLSTFKDGFIILRKIFSITRAYKPLTFFGGLGIFFVITGWLLGIITITQPGLSLQHSLYWMLLSIFLIFFGLISGAVGVTIHTLNFRLLELANVLTRIHTGKG